MSLYKKIFIVCPSYAVTGGPEALHQLAFHMNSLGLSAYMSYIPFDQPASAPCPYKHYKTESTPYEDVKGNLIIFPEIYPNLALKIRYAQSAIWWLSLDNFLERRHVSPFYDHFRYLKRVFQGRRPIRGARALKNLLHFSQTEYSSEYLRLCGINPIPLIDSISEDFLSNRFLNYIDHKKNIILYNPSKGFRVTSKLIERFPQWQFEPLENLTRGQISNKLYNAKIYIDFGHHPGRDRLPREAAMHGCAIITGLLGSAGNSKDLPIPQVYKLDSNAPEFERKFELLVYHIMNHFLESYSDFDHYRKWLKNEPILFKNQIKEFFLP